MHLTLTRKLVLVRS